MKKLILFFVLFCISQSIVLSQPCLQEGITFSTQSQIDSFQIIYPNCTEIEGYVIIYGNDITNLNGLNVLTSIGGNFRIGNDNYPYNGNPLLLSLAGLDNLASIGGNLNINGNPLLTSLAGLENLTDIEGDLSIGSPSRGWENDNLSLASLSGLDNVTTIGGNLVFLRNRLLTSLIGLGNLTAIEGSLIIGGSHGGGTGYKRSTCLTCFTGLDNLSSIGGNIEIIENDSLISFSGLNNLTSIGGSLMIGAFYPPAGGNESLTSLSGLDNIDAGSITELIICDNNSLSTCEVQSVCDYLASPTGTIFIADNASGCNSMTEVEEACWVGISNLNFESEFSIYPNPATDKLIITSNSGLKIETVNIYNQLGQKVIEGELLNNTINVSKLRRGIYIIELTSNELKIRMKLMIR